MSGWLAASGRFPVTKPISMSQLFTGFNLQTSSPQLTYPFQLTSLIGRNLYNSDGSSAGIVPAGSLSLSYFLGKYFLKVSPPVTLPFVSKNPPAWPGPSLFPYLDYPPTPTKITLTITGASGGGGGGGGAYIATDGGYGGPGGSGASITTKAYTYDQNLIASIELTFYPIYGGSGGGGGGGGGVSSGADGGVGTAGFSGEIKIGGTIVYTAGGGQGGGGGAGATSVPNASDGVPGAGGGFLLPSSDPGASATNGITGGGGVGGNSGKHDGGDGGPGGLGGNGSASITYYFD